MSYTPEPNRKQSIPITLLLFAFSLVFIFFSLMTDNMASSALRASSFVFIFAAMGFSSRYLMFSVSYVAGDFEFLITNNSFNRTRTVCRLAYSEITSVEPYKKVKKSVKELRKHNYCVSPFPEDAYVILFNGRKETEAVIFEPDARFLNCLKSRIRTDFVF